MTKDHKGPAEHLDVFRINEIIYLGNEECPLTATIAMHNARFLQYVLIQVIFEHHLPIKL